MSGPSIDLLARAEQLREEHEGRIPVEERKRRGQVFTPPAVCRFMASLVAVPRGEFRLLDPGAGMGSLTAAVCERLLGMSAPRTVELHAFENDPDLLPLLEEVLKRCAAALEGAGHRASFLVHRSDFITGPGSAPTQAELFSGRRALGQFDAAIMNPPSYKIAGDSEYARAMPDVVHGQPNIYSLFMAQAARMLRPGGTLVVITPRSFCNGLYFRGFRRWYFERMQLRRVHLFESRKETFKNVLQESVITAARRDGGPPEQVEVSHGLARDLHRVEVLRLPAADVLDDSAGDMVVRIPTSPADVEAIEAAAGWPRFADLGLRISTGPVVEFRSRPFLVQDADEPGTVPLISLHNVRPFETVWPVEKNGRPLAFRVQPESMALLVPARNYVLLRRFSAKEERRRLTASPLMAGDLHGEHRALENHLNYVYHAERELTEDEVLGLVALFNSSLFDRYFRTFSGSTQVNATEIRTMHFPPLDVVEQLGSKVRSTGAPPEGADAAVTQALGIDSRPVSGAGA